MFFAPLTVVIPTRGTNPTLIRTLEALAGQAGPLAIIVVEDGVSPGWKEAVRAAVPGVLSFTWMGRGWGGPAAARNTGWRAAGTEVIAFLDDDVVPDPAWLAALRQAIAAHPEAGGWEGKTRAPELHRPMTHSVENLKGGLYLSCNIAYRREVLETEAGFDETFAAPINEDQDLGLRVRATRPVVFVPGMAVTHPPKPGTFFRTLASRARFAHDYFYSEIFFYTKHPEAYKTVRAFPSFRQTLRRQVLLYAVIQIRPRLLYWKSRPWALLQNAVISLWAQICLGWTAFRYLF
jgi:GT2 family glycosyltransferase